jgi:hypothetical protein
MSDIRHTPRQENVVADALSHPGKTWATGQHTANTGPAANLLHRSHQGLAGRGVGCPRMSGFSGNRLCAAGRLFGDGRTAAILPRSCKDAKLWQPAVHITSGLGRFLAWGRVKGGIPPASSHPVERGSVPVAALHPPPRGRATQRLITARFCWPQMAMAITLMARACLFC